MARILWWLSLLAFAAPTIALPQDFQNARQVAAQFEVRDLAAHQDDLQKRASTVFITQATAVVVNTVVVTNAQGSTVTSASTTSVASSTTATSSIASTTAASQTSGSSAATSSSNASGSVAGAAASSTPTSTASATSSNSGTGGGLSGGAIAGIVVGVIAALVIVAGLTYYFASKRRDQAGVDGVNPHNMDGGAAEQRSYESSKLPAESYPAGRAEVQGSTPNARPSQGPQTTITGGAGAGAGLSGTQMSELPAETSAHRATQQQVQGSGSNSRPWSPADDTLDGRRELPVDNEQREYK